jgi:rubredoxin
MEMKYKFRHMRPTFLGWQCRQCGWIYPHAAFAVLHDERIDEHGGICPDRAEKKPPASDEQKVR